MAGAVEGADSVTYRARVAQRESARPLNGERGLAFGRGPIGRSTRPAGSICPRSSKTAECRRKAEVASSILAEGSTL